MEGGGQDLYDHGRTRKLWRRGALPDGCQLHIAGPYENGWRVITVWDSEERFQRFRDEKLIARDSGGWWRGPHRAEHHRGPGSQSA